MRIELPAAENLCASCGACGWFGSRDELIWSSPASPIIYWSCPECGASGDTVGIHGGIGGVPSLDPDAMAYVTDRFCRENGERYRRNLVRFHRWLTVYHDFTTPYSLRPVMSVRFINDSKYPDQDWAAPRAELTGEALTHIQRYQRDYWNNR